MGFTIIPKLFIQIDTCCSIGPFDFPSISLADKDWDDIKFGVENKVDFYAVSFVKDAKVVHELKDYLQSNCSNRISYV